MTDKELLELAAKAAGISVEPHGNYKHSPNLVFTHRGQNWNPLTDDGDALRLAVKLGMNVMCHGDAVVVAYSHPRNVFRELHATCPYAATRRAIVRAAAEIGKEMK